MRTKSVRVPVSVALLLAATITAVGQNLKFPKSRMALSEAFNEISVQTGRFVSFNEGVLNVNTVVSVPSGTVTLQDALASILSGLGMEYAEVNGQIVITPKSAVQDRSHTYSGYVRDSNGEALPGAMIRIGGFSEGVMTDAEGKFSLKAPRGTELTASYIGYSEGSVILGDKNSVVIRLESIPSTLMKRFASAMER